MGCKKPLNKDVIQKKKKYNGYIITELFNEEKKIGYKIPKIYFMKDNSREILLELKESEIMGFFNRNNLTNIYRIKNIYKID